MILSSDRPNLNKIRLAVGVLALAVWIVLFRETFSSLYRLAVTDNGHSHLLAIPFLAIFFLFYDRKRIFNSRRTNTALQGILTVFFGVLGAGLFLFWGGSGPGPRFQDGLSLSAASAVLLLFAVFLWVFKGVGLSAAFFPGLLLLLMIPIPGGLREAIVAFLVKGTAQLTEILFRLTGTTFFREQEVFLLPGISIEIADICSGIRSSIGLLITVLLAGHLFFRRVWSKVVLVVLVLPLVLVKNAMRVAGLTLLSLHVDPSFLHNSLHHTYGGMVFFALTLVLFLFPILLVLRKLEGTGGSRSGIKVGGL